MRKANQTSGRKTAKAKTRAALSAQQTIPYVAMHPDGVCKLPGGLYTKTVEYEDINYSVASTEDQTAIFGGWSSFLNYFDSSLPFQLSFINRRSHSRSRYKVNIPQADDDFNSVREEFTGMLKNQIARSNNGIERSKYITFGIPAGGIVEARPRLERVEADVMGNFKRLGVPCEPMDGRARLALLHSQMHPGNREPFRFSWKDIPQTGLGTKDYIAPDSFDFRHSRLFRVGQYWGAVSYLQILASELSDKLLAEILELDAEMTVTLHIQTVDQLKAIKTIKGKISDIGKMKVEEQRKAVRAGYDPDILPPDLITFSKDAAELLADLQSRNERMFLLTFTVVNMAPTRQRLENDVFTVGGIAQKYNCALKRLDWQQEQGFVSSLALGYNEVEIQRGMTTSSTAIFIPFMTRELRMDGQALYHNKERKHVPLSQQKEFRSIKNAVIREAENIRQCNLFFEDKGVEQESEPEEFRNASYDYENLRDAIRNESLTLEERGDAVDEMNKLAKSGDKYAQYLMGKLWRDGPLLTPDWVNARYWFQKSAEQGHTYAQYALGNSSEQKLILVFMSISYRGLCVMEIPDIHSP